MALLIRIGSMKAGVQAKMAPTMAFLGNAPINFGDSAEFEYDDEHDHDHDENDDDTFQPPRSRTNRIKMNDCDEVRVIGSRTLQLPNAHRCSS